MKKSLRNILLCLPILALICFIPTIVQAACYNSSGCACGGKSACSLAARCVDSCVGHNWTDTRDVTSGSVTCTTGQTIDHQKYCSICGVWLSTGTSTTSALGHSWSTTWCNSYSSHWHVCSRCGATADGAYHSFGSWTNAGGNHTRKCTVCGYTETGDHSFGGYACNHNGTKTKKCGTCGATSTANITYYVSYSANTSAFASNCPNKTASGSTSTQTCTYGYTYSALSALTNPYYRQTSWSGLRCGASYANLKACEGDTYSNSAVWAAKKYRIQYNINAPSSVYSGTSTITGYISTESSVTLLSNPDYYCRGYYVVGWSTNPNASSASYSLGATEGAFWYAPPGTSDSDVLNLYAIWKPYTYEVTYKAGDGVGADYTETWTYNSNHNLFNNTPQLPNTSGTTTPRFTKEGYYIDYWIVSATGTRETSLDAKTLLTGTGYSGDTIVSATKAYKNIITPGGFSGQLLSPNVTKGHDCKVTLTAHWAPIRYKVQYNNDTTSIVNRGYTSSTGTYTTPAYDYAAYYDLYNLPSTRSNKYGDSTWLGYGVSNGDVSKNPKWYLNGRSPASYASGRLTQITATNLTGLVTTSGTTYANYFKYLNSGTIQSFPIYCVWDDCPGIEPIDLQWGGNAYDANSIIQYDKMTNSSTKSGLESEYQILNNIANKNTVWDREDDVSSITSDMKNKYYLQAFSNLNIKNQKVYSNGTVEPTAYELKYTVIDDNGNTYQTTRKLYVGDLADIKVGGSALQ